MSSRSKDRVSAAIRKIFKVGDRVEPIDRKDKNASTKTDQLPDSPGKKIRWQDNKVTPTSNNKTSNNNPMNSTETKVSDTSIRTRRLMKEFQTMQKLQSTKDAIYSVELINDNLYEWYARLNKVDPDSKLAKDMREMDVPCILLHLVFPQNFPFMPPFMRVVEPRIEKGFVMEGGAICMELLTPRGWASAYTVEAVLMQFSASLVKGQARIMRTSKNSKEFNRRNAEESFRSLVKTHDKYGWVTPALSDG